ncbi:TRAP transporter permease [Limnohabitans planktonicus]|uniref:C4-dicarboxylate ABC transporter permease n=1 Tax=Limnohabitans planktonicus II-D5 TaxID=1293045 RepID=A0A2T7UG00_9BURK|nr:TRAP transporter permease [Limnohabitans planktonicus]PVE43592.1 C4-dicarboxylate ABC transporter permease [Limnohabitans planktonicus II-D5]|eukprot:gene16774-19123_t
MAEALERNVRNLQELEEKFDPEMRFRPTLPPATVIVKWLLIILSGFHFYTAGFGLLRETTHRGVHLAFVLGLIFLVFAATKSDASSTVSKSRLSIGGVPLIDWLLGLACAASVMYIPYVFDDLAFRVGNPDTMDVVMGSVLFVTLLEATRRSMGWPLPLIALGFTAYALTGPYFPGLLKHAGASWSQMINHQYLTSQGIYGVAVGVVATYVFHFVLFGVLATRIGLGQLFLDIASTVAGRYAGGPAKVSVFGSAMFGTLSGSSVANAVTVGSLTIPAMIRVGYKREFAGAVEAASSTGGQITPPVLGAAAFLMVEFLNVSYQTIIAAAIVPAFMHFFGVFMQVHFEAKRYGLRGLTEEEMPKLRESFRQRWPTLIPLALLIAILVSGRTPYLAAFTGITSCMIVGLSTTVWGNRSTNWLMLVVLHVLLALVAFVDWGSDGETIKLGFLALGVALIWAGQKWLGLVGRIDNAVLLEAFETGAKYALAVGAAAATVGIVIGVVTLTGVGFKISFIITGWAQMISAFLMDWLPAFMADSKSLTLLAALFMTGIVCILMGCGIPTTANYIIMVTVAAPTLVQLGVEPLVAHFFVFYYGVLADITPPVALAAYAAAGMAGGDPFKTGNMAFRLGLAKVLVPFVFVFSPSLLLVAKGFTWADFAITFTGCVLGIVALAAALSGYLMTVMNRWERTLCTIGALCLIAPGLKISLLGVALMLPVLIHQWTMSPSRKGATLA